MMFLKLFIILGARIGVTSGAVAADKPLVK